MKAGQFFIIVGLLVVVLYIVARTGLGLQKAEQKVTSAGNVVTGLLGKLGLNL